MATINHKTYNEATETFKDFNVYDGKETLIFKVDGEGGNVGIGTSSPTDTIGYGRALDIQSSTGAVVYLRDSNAPTTQYGFLAFDGSDNGLKLQNANSSGFLRFDTNATEKMRITSAGNVGIGTSTPTSKLHVQGTSYFFDQSIFSDKVGIGTSSPIGKLHVEGVGSGQGIRLNHSASNSFIYSTIANSDDIAFDNLLGNLAIYTGGAERLRVLSTGGLTFNGDTAAANALDDYEEGTWTPQISNGTTNVAISNSYSTYTKIGRQVTVNTRMVNGDLSSFSSGDNISFIGLPFTSGGDYYSTIYVRGAVSGNLVRLLAIGNGTTTAATDLFVSELVDGASDYWFTATYFV
jgi:hypothetical protein